MTDTQIVLITLLSVLGFGTLIVWIARFSDYEADNVWIGPIIMIVMGLFIYVVVSI
jgi:hypothetical protein